jgi:hypothetical protein
VLLRGKFQNNLISIDLRHGRMDWVTGKSVFNATFNNISALSVEKNYWPAASYWSNLYLVEHWSTHKHDAWSKELI